MQYVSVPAILASCFQRLKARLMRLAGDSSAPQQHHPLWLWRPFAVLIRHFREPYHAQSPALLTACRCRCCGPAAGRTWARTVYFYALDAIAGQRWATQHQSGRSVSQLELPRLPAGCAGRHSLASAAANPAQHSAGAGPALPHPARPGHHRLPALYYLAAPGQRHQQRLDLCHGPGVADGMARSASAYWPERSDLSGGRQRPAAVWRALAPTRRVAGQCKPLVACSAAELAAGTVGRLAHATPVCRRARHKQGR